jgi:4-hydroxybenzoate polyprenyltransferase
MNQTVKTSGWLEYARLMRLANVFTAVADPLAGWLVVGGFVAGEPIWTVLALMAASACLYTSGIVFNDCFDYEMDLRERSERPLPRGAIAVGRAWWLAGALMAAGIGVSVLAGPVALGTASFLAAMIFFYNAWAKQYAGLGPLTLGVCRFANFFLGMRALPEKLWLAPVVLGVYVMVVTWIARSEVTRPALRKVVKQMLLGIIVLDAVLVLWSPLGPPLGALAVAVLIVPAVLLSQKLAMT